MNKKQKDDIKFLKSQLKKIKKTYQMADHRDYCDTSDDDSFPETSEEMERCAHLANRNGLDGNVFRNLYPPPLDCDPDIIEVWRFYGKQIEMIPGIIENIEHPDPKDYSLPMPPAEWAKYFKISTDTLKARVEAGDIRTLPHGPKSFRVHKHGLDYPLLRSFFYPH